MEEELSLDNIMGTNDIDSLFTEYKEETQENNSPEEKEDTKETTEVNPDSLFQDNPESVGSEDNSEETEDSTQTKGGTSSNQSFYSSIAKAFKEEGIFPDLDDDALESINSPEEFRDVVEQQIKASLDERQRRIDDALNAGVEVSDIKKYESTISYLNSIDENTLTDESDKGETLRKNLIYQDFINRGYSKERATKEVNKSFSSGSDIEDAREALQSNKEYFAGEYDSLIKEAKDNENKLIKEREAQTANLKKSILEEKELFGDLEVDKNTRQKIFDNIVKPVYKDSETGQYYTALQKYEKENKQEFLKKLGLIFTLTDGFKNLDGLVKTKVRKEVKKGIKNLENVINNTSRNSGGSIQFSSGVDSESFIGKGYRIDI